MVRPHADGKVFAPWCASKTGRLRADEEPEEHKLSEQDEIYEVKTIDWENYSWKYLSLVGDEQVITLQRTKVHVFSDSVLCLGKTH